MSTPGVLLTWALLALLGLGLGVPGEAPLNSCCPIVPRREWRAPVSRCTEKLQLPVRNVVVSHTAGSHCNSPALCLMQVQNVHSYHTKSLNWCDVGYNFLIGEDGLVYEGRGWDTKGDHTGVNWNPISIGISFMGNYMERSPPPRALRAAQSLLACGVAQGKLNPRYQLRGHRDVQQTLSPGDRLYEIIQTWPHYVD
ncbi:peptidoglycan recognition protein 1 [Lycaon pictus]|uniref:Peptidoglycan-recognition protein n=2 Tax=Canis lupus TaxID=9612 RepID=A0A8P0NPF2_CANLF|nr:peptidoglycan recognition protein 1 [Canis lupus dingo]XP_038384451.1 peptidoglycan recognition protein 1 isoform X1 [Canis lupus familiaris]XP_038512531.1 peptidoglycan recognition protein 1 isoform X1 [Canis lupus familiaris]XP_855038.1 peptidoglycan recognition protein 1 isoform X1 [Canis lupus familiaris]|eukprot:XP_855038.1 peptidoglycan recognition protein 1 [Canis lupus familiaris]